MGKHCCMKAEAKGSLGGDAEALGSYGEVC